MREFNIKEIPRIQLCLLPTPIVPLKRLSEHLGGANIFIKRDDLTGIAFGGNKNRKLEYLLADAKRKGSNVILTEGALQSNHCLQTAASALKTGFQCELVLSGNLPEIITGNLLLDQILGVKIHYVKNIEQRKCKLQKTEADLREKGYKPYVIPTGGSTKIGALGYVNCISEIKKQSNRFKTNFNYFVHSTGSGGTQSGAIIGKELYYPDMNIIGISEGEPKEFLRSKISEIITEFIKDWKLNLSVEQLKIEILDEYFGEGYGIPSEEMINAVKLVAKLEGIFLDPVYNGKAMVGLIDLIQTKIISNESNVLFLHSGGGPALFSYNSTFTGAVEF